MSVIVQLVGAAAVIAIAVSCVVLYVLIRGDRTYRRDTTIPGSPEHILSHATQSEAS